MRLTLRGVELSFTFWFFTVILCFAVLGKGTLIFYFLLPIVVHELGHLLVMACYPIQISAVRFTAVGVEIRRCRGGRGLSYGQETVVSLGGIAANLLVALGLYLFCFQSMRIMFLVAANVAVALFNLLPIGNLDGGQVLRLMAGRFSAPDTARYITTICSLCVLAVLFGVAIFLLWIRYSNPSLLIVCVYLAVNVLSQNE